MARLTRAALVAAATIGLCATALAIGGAGQSEREPDLTRLLTEQNAAAKARMDAFDLRLKLAADRVIRSVCSGCLPETGTETVAVPTPRRMRVARRWRTAPRRAVAHARPHRPLRLTVRDASQRGKAAAASRRVRESAADRAD